MEAQEVVHGKFKALDVTSQLLILLIFQTEPLRRGWTLQCQPTTTSNQPSKINSAVVQPPESHQLH